MHFDFFAIVRTRGGVIEGLGYCSDERRRDRGTIKILLVASVYPTERITHMRRKITSYVPYVFSSNSC
jgi:hypothetical protein